MRLRTDPTLYRHRKRRRFHLSRLFSSLPGLLFLVQCAPVRGADLAEIVARGNAMLKSDWAADINYAYIDKEEVLKNGRMTSRTSQVVYVAGSDYYLPLAADDQPLPEDREKAEREKLKAEAARRASETPEARRDRIARFKRQRAQNEAMVLDFPDAFDFRLLGEETIDGRDAYVLSGMPKKRDGPLTLAQKVLSGMKGRVWVDKESFHAIRVECDVITPVPVYGVLAKVLPGTHIEFAMAPVTESVWLVSELKMTLSLSKIFVFHSTQVTRSTFTGYRVNQDVLAELLAN